MQRDIQCDTTMRYSATMRSNIWRYELCSTHVSQLHAERHLFVCYTQIPREHRTEPIEPAFIICSVFVSLSFRTFRAFRVEHRSNMPICSTRTRNFRSNMTSRSTRYFEQRFSVRLEFSNMKSSFESNRVEFSNALVRRAKSELNQVQDHGLAWSPGNCAESETFVCYKHMYESLKKRCGQFKIFTASLTRCITK